MRSNPSVGALSASVDSHLSLRQSVPYSLTINFTFCVASENGPSLTVSAPQFHMTPVIEVPTVSVETEPLPQPSIQVNFAPAQLSSAPFISASSQIGYASSAVNSEFESEDSDNDMSD